VAQVKMVFAQAPEAATSQYCTLVCDETNKKHHRKEKTPKHESCNELTLANEFWAAPN
jgi:hypothetical protein